MRTFLLFDLPSITDNDKKRYRIFVKEVKKLGFYMIQESVYVKFTLDLKSANSIISKVDKIKPKYGNIILLNVTEKQYNSMKILLGEINTNVLNSTDRYVVI